VYGGGHSVDHYGHVPRFRTLSFERAGQCRPKPAELQRNVPRHKGIRHTTSGLQTRACEIVQVPGQLGGYNPFLCIDSVPSIIDIFLSSFLPRASPHASPSHDVRLALSYSPRRRVVIDFCWRLCTGFTAWRNPRRRAGNGEGRALPGLDPGRGHNEATLLSKQLRWRSQLLGRSM